jgi:hypothetical protein
LAGLALADSEEPTSAEIAISTNVSAVKAARVTRLKKVAFVKKEGLCCLIVVRSRAVAPVFWS